MMVKGMTYLELDQKVTYLELDQKVTYLTLWSNNDMIFTDFIPNTRMAETSLTRIE